MITRLVYRCTFLLVLVFGLSACNKLEDDYISKYCPSSCTEVTGKVLRSNGQPFANVQVLATWKTGNGTFKGGGGTTRKKAVGYTDAQGSYTLRFLIRDSEMSYGRFEVALQGTNCSSSHCPSSYLYWNKEVKRDTTFIYDFVVD